MDGLPWERQEGTGGTGVCLSGGGVRAAAFALGAIQALQEERGLLFGPRCAEMLAVVSGGSYIGGAMLLNAAAMGDRAVPVDSPPLAEGSAEAEHVVGHGRYLFEGGPLRVAGRFLLPGFGNFVAVLAFLAWTGMMLATYAWIGEGAGIAPAGGDAIWLVAVAGAVALGFSVRGLYKDGGAKRFLYPLVGLVLFFFCAPSLIAALAGWSRSPTSGGGQRAGGAP